MTLDLTAAFSIAVEIHGAQRDKVGEPMLFHVMRVAMAMDDDWERATALLHDAIEDTPGSFVSFDGSYIQTEKEKLLLRIELLYGEAVSHAVFALTRQDYGVDKQGHWCAQDEPYLDYIRRLSSNPLAVKVKLSDLDDNLDATRLGKLPEAEMERLWKKYRAAQAYLLSMFSKEACRHPDRFHRLNVAGGGLEKVCTQCGGFLSKMIGQDTVPMPTAQTSERPPS